jgi:hypothetical protein
VIWRIVLGVQVVTFACLGVYFVQRHDYRLGVAQLLLAAVQAIIYSGGL